MMARKWAIGFWAGMGHLSFGYGSRMHSYDSLSSSRSQLDRLKLLDPPLLLDGRHVFLLGGQEKHFQAPPDAHLQEDRSQQVP